GRLREFKAARRARQASAEDAKLAKSVDHFGGDLGLAIDRDRIDVVAAEVAESSDPMGGALVVRVIGLGEEGVVQMLGKEQSLGKAALRGPIGQEFFGFRDLLFSIDGHVSSSWHAQARNRCYKCSPPAKWGQADERWGTTCWQAGSGQEANLPQPAFP